MTSKFRTVFWIGNAIVPFVSIIVLLYCVRGLIINEDFIIGNIVIGLASLTTLILGYYALINIKKIRLNENQIELIFVFTLKKETIHTSEIKEIRLKRQPGLRSKGGFISDGYNYSELILSNKEVIISPDIYENYDDLIRELHSMKSKHVV